MLNKKKLIVNYIVIVERKMSCKEINRPMFIKIHCSIFCILRGKNSFRQIFQFINFFCYNSVVHAIDMNRRL